MHDFFASIPPEILKLLAGWTGGLLAGTFALVECLTKNASLQKGVWLCYLMFLVGLGASGPFALIWSSALGSQIKMFSGVGVYPGAFVLGLITMMASPWIQRRAMAALKKGDSSYAEPNP